MRRDWITGLLLMGVAFGYYYMADALPRSLLSDEVGADGFPKLLAISLLLLSVIMVVMGVFTRPSVTAAEAQEKAVTERHAAIKAAGMFLLGVGYLAVVTWVGYPVAVGLLIAGVLLFQRETLSLKLVIIACFGGIFFWFFFVIVLKIPLPSGIWSDLFSGGL